MTGVDEAAEADGPWRAAAHLRVVVLGDPAEAETGAVASGLAAALGGAGLPVAHHAVVALAGAAAFLADRADSALDTLVLDSETAVSAQAIRELRRVVDGDPMLVAAMPRFRTADDDPEDVRRPAVTYEAAADHRCLYVKGSVLADFGGDLWAEPAHPSLAGLLLSFNRLGFRTAVAHRAVALHPAGGTTGRSGVAGLHLAPPHWRPALARYLASAPVAAEALLDGLRPGPDGRRAVAFDLAHLGPGHSGTAHLARALMARAAARWRDLDLHVVASQQAFAFHCAGLGLPRTDPGDPRHFAAAIRFGQPFLWKEIDATLRRAPVLVVFMLDTIGLDCLEHAPDEIDALWRFVFAEADGVLFNSAFTERQFARRFAFRPDLPRRPSLHSLRLADYRDTPEAPAPARSGGILVVGNSFPHKRLRETAAALARARLPDPVVVLGLAPGTVDGVTTAASGRVAPSAMADFYRAARVVVYPSVYEGFGFPILEALSHRRPILVRPLPPYSEIAADLPEAANIHSFRDDAELVDLLRHPLAWVEGPDSAPAVRNWDDAADDLRAVLDEALQGASLDRVVRRIDVLRGRMAFMRGLPFGADPDGEAARQDLDRLAGLAGRLAQRGVLAVGHRIPGSRALLALAHRLRARRPIP